MLLKSTLSTYLESRPGTPSSISFGHSVWLRRSRSASAKNNNRLKSNEWIRFNYIRVEICWIFGQVGGVGPVQKGKLHAWHTYAMYRVPLPPFDSLASSDFNYIRYYNDRRKSFGRIAGFARLNWTKPSTVQSKRDEKRRTRLQINFQCIVDIQLAVQAEVPYLFSHENNAIFVFNVKNILCERHLGVGVCVPGDCGCTLGSLSL